MRQTLFALSLGFGVVILATYAGFAQAACARRDSVIAALVDQYGESRQVIGLGANNHVMEVYASTKTGTWSIVITGPDGLSCLAATGNSYESLADSLSPKGDPA